MAFCPTCGKELSAEESKAKFCAHCGAPLATETTEEPVNEAVSNDQPEQAKSFDVNESIAALNGKISDMKEKAGPSMDRLYEKVKTIPVLGSLVGKAGQKLFPALLAAAVAVIALILVIVISAASSSC